MICINNNNNIRAYIYIYIYIYIKIISKWLTDHFTHMPSVLQTSWRKLLDKYKR